MTPDPKIAVHPCPALHSNADFIIFADLSEHGLSSCWEQLWARKVSPSEFELCCIPFFTYGFALGDYVLTHPKDGKDYVVKRVSRKSGRVVLRIWFGELDSAVPYREVIEKYVKAENWYREWSSDNLVAVDVPSSQQAASFINFLECQIASGIAFEMGV